MRKFLVDSDFIKYLEFQDDRNELDVCYIDGRCYTYRDVTKEEYHDLISYQYPDAYFMSKIQDEKSRILINER